MSFFLHKGISVCLTYNQQWLQYSPDMMSNISESNHSIVDILKFPKYIYSKLKLHLYINAHKKCILAEVLTACLCDIRYML